MSDLEAEAALIAAAQSDPTRFTGLDRQHVAGVHALAWSRLGDRAAAEDVTAETFRRALRALPRYEFRGVPYRAWLWRICINLTNDELRRRQRASRFNAALPAEPPTPITDDVARADTRALVHSLVARLSTTRAAAIFPPWEARNGSQSAASGAFQATKHLVAGLQTRSGRRGRPRTTPPGRPLPPTMPPNQAALVDRLYGPSA